MAESADASDLKSDDGDIVWVRPPLALLKNPGELSPGCSVSVLMDASCSMNDGPVSLFSVRFASDQIFYFQQILHDEGLFPCGLRGTAFRKVKNAFYAGVDRTFNIVVPIH